jgi:hypothetical protein
MILPMLFSESASASSCWAFWAGDGRPNTTTEKKSDDRKPKREEVEEERRGEDLLGFQRIGLPIRYVTRKIRQSSQQSEKHSSRSDGAKTTAQKQSEMGGKKKEGEGERRKH